MRSKFLQKNWAALLLVALLFVTSCIGKQSSQKESLPQVAYKALEDGTSLFYGHYENYPKELLKLPIGMFDSGTGGLTVMEQFLSLDSFNNETGEVGADGVPDFLGENFIYLADQANMPYGVYPSQGKEEYLRELIVKDALFLTTEPNRTKIVVIACNTATAYGLQDIKALLEHSKTGVKVVGVINAGVEGALSIADKKGEAFAVGVLATVGTISSCGYQNALKRYANEGGYSGDLRVVSQGGLGFAEAVDSEPDYISNSAHQIRENYRGPKFGEPDGIQKELLHLYNFDMSGNNLLMGRDKNGEIVDIQLNSTGNYARFHMVSLLQKHREENSGVKMMSVILGCTHYPYLVDTLNRVVEELRVYKEGEEYPFAALLEENLLFVDPAFNTAIETYNLLLADSLLKRGENSTSLSGYISVAHKSLGLDKRDEFGNLRFDYKYGRETGSESPSVSIVPFSKSNINEDNLARIEERLPNTYALINENL